MNVKIEQKLKELLELSLEQSAPAAHAVIHLLYANYLNGSQNDFAKWCCQHTIGLSMNASIDGGEQIPPKELSHEPVTNEWVC